MLTASVYNHDHNRQDGYNSEPDILCSPLAGTLNPLPTIPRAARSYS
ncbi:MAG: hypothetical protein GPOALKHO_000360 [Sodalis sp.]|nr:MAG: hypothetical protein GPOALKHO_000360 [Sodalis sp.]